MTLTDPPSRCLPPKADGDPWMTFTDEQSVERTLGLVRAHPGTVAVWLDDLPTRFTPEQEAVLWEVALRARTLVVPTRCALARVLASGVVHPSSVVVVPLPTRLTQADPSPIAAWGGAPLVVTPTCLHEAERVDMVLDALAALRRRSLEFRYHVVVDASSHRVRGLDSSPSMWTRALERWELWQRRAHRLGLDGAVQWSLEADAVATMTTAQAVVLPWAADDLVASQALVDAVSLGVPVVASAFPHAVELAPTGAVTLWRPDSTEALERALHRVLTRPLLRTAMRHAARQAAQAHRPQAVQQRLQRLALEAPRGQF